MASACRTAAPCHSPVRKRWNVRLNRATRCLSVAGNSAAGRHPLNDFLALTISRQCSIKTCTDAVELDRQRDAVACKDRVSCHFIESNAIVLQQSYVAGIFQVWMEIEQDINARLRNRADVLQHFLRLRVVQLRFERCIEALQAVRDSPAKQG